MSKHLNSLQLHLDAGESAIAARALEHIEQRITETLYTELFATKYLPVIGGVDPGARLYTFAVVNQVGNAVVIRDFGQDLPSVDVTRTENYQGIVSIGDKFSYTVQELREIVLAERFGSIQRLDQARANNAALACARKADDMIAFGDAASGTVMPIRGFVNNANVGSPGSASGSWATLAASGTDSDKQKILKDLTGMVTSVVKNSQMRVIPDTLLLDIDSMQLIGQTPISAINPNRTILEVFVDTQQKMQQPIEVAAWPLLSTAGAAGVKRAICYRRDPTVVGCLLPLPFMAQPAQAKDLRYEVPCESRCGGAVVYQPFGVYYLDGM